MSLLLLPEDSYRRKLTSITDEPRSPALTDTGWGPMVSAALETMSAMHDVTNGQLLIGYSATAALAIPTVAPAVTPGTSGTIPDGTYYLKYSYTNAVGETLTGPAQTITLSGGGTNSFTTAALTLPSGVTGIKWYLSTISGGLTLRLIKANNGTSFSQIVLPSTSDGQEPVINTTSTDNHPEKGTLTGGTGLAVTNGPGTISLAYNPTNHVDQNGFYLRRLRIENFTTSTLPNLTPSDKGRLAYNTTTNALVFWDGSNWQSLLSSSITSVVGGDLSGNLPNPTVVGLQGRAVSNSSPTNGQILTFSTTSNSWVPSSPALSSNATSIRGTPVGTATPTTGQAIVFNGTSYVPTTIIATSGNATSVGSIPVSAVAPSVGQVLVFNGTVYVPQDVVAVTGNANTLAGYPVSSVTPNPDEVLAWDGAQWEPTPITIIPPASGVDSGTLTLTQDLGGSSTAPVVVGIQTVPVLSTTPTTGQALIYNGSAYAPSDVVGSSDAVSIRGKSVSSTAPSNGQILVFVSGSNSWVPTSTPSANAITIQGVAVDTTTPTNGQALVFNSGANKYVPTDVTGGGGSGDATSIQSIPVDATTPTNGQALIYDSSSATYIPTNIPAGDATSLRTIPVDATTPTNGYVLTYSSTSGSWGPAAGGGGGGSNATSLQGVAINSATPVTGQYLFYNGTQWLGKGPESTYNRAINGAFDALLGVGTSGTINTGVTYMTPMWRFSTDGVPVDPITYSFTIRQVDSGGGTSERNGLPPTIINYLEVDALANATYNEIYYRVENLGFNIRNIVVSFFVKNSSGGTHSVRLTDLYGAQVSATAPTFTPTTAWVRQTKVFTISTTNNDYAVSGMFLKIALPTGTDRDFFITGVQIEASNSTINGVSGGDLTVAGNYIKPRPADEINAAQRYVAFSSPGPMYGGLFYSLTGGSDVNGAFTFHSTGTGATTQLSPVVQFPTIMIYVPSTIFFRSVKDSTQVDVYNETQDEHCTSTTAVRVGQSGFVIQFTGSSSTVPGDILSVHWLASAETP
jgi:hypothetical protein